MTTVTFPKLALFDWDGTIVHSAMSILNAHNHVRQILGLEPWDMLALIQKAARIGTARETFTVLYPDHVDIAHDTYYEHINANRFSTLEIIEGVINLLSLLKEHNITLGIVSNMKHNSLVEEVEKMGLKDYFSVIVGAGEAPRGKPYPDAIYLALERLGLPKEILAHTWFFGDMETDEKASKAAGCQFWYYMGGISDADEQANMQAHVKFDHYDRAIEIFTSLTPQ